MADADITAAAVAAATASTTAVSGSFSFSAAAVDGEMDAATVAVSAAKQSAGYFRGRSFRPLFCTAGVLTVNLPFLFLLLPLAFLIDLVNAVSIYHKSSHKTPLKFFNSICQKFYTADPADRTGCKYAADDSCGVRESV